jgi:signal transduction histidine kinase/ActR/RegA family two-component response regulator
MPKIVLPLKLILLALGSATAAGMMLFFAVSVQKVSTESLAKQIGRTLAVTADEVQDEFDRIFLERYHDISIVATQAGATRDLGSDAARALLDQFLKLYPEFTWLGLITTDTKIIAAVGDPAVAQRVLQAQWLRMIASAQTAARPGMGLLLPVQGGSDALSARSSIGLAAPVRDQSGAVIGVAVAGWDWTQSISFLTTPTNLGLEHASAYILSGDGRVLLGPANRPDDVTKAQSYLMALKGVGGSVVEAGPNGGQYFTGFSRAKTERLVGEPGLIVLVRQDAAIALAPLAELKSTILVFLLLFAGHAVAFNWVLSTKVVAPLLEIAAASDRLRRTGDARIPHLTQFAEVQVLSESLIALVGELNERQNSLIALSTSLEAKVQDRTRALADRNRSLAEATDIAERATAAKSRLLASASHDLRQPLHAINLYCLALKRRVTAQDAAQMIVRVEQSLDSLKSMLDALLHIARLDAGQVSRKLVPVRIRDLIEQIGAEFSIEADQRGLRFNYTSVDCHVLIDTVLFEAILRNLLSNALKFTNAGGVVLAARSRGSRVLIEVYDTGPGIETTRLERIFNEFERSRDQATGPNEGLGLGLSIVERHAQLIGAELSVRSVVGHGSRFSVSIAKTNPTNVTKPQFKAAPPDRTIRGMNILLLDDNVKVLAALRQDLLDRGADVYAFDRAALALDALENELLVDAAVVDYDLREELTGIDFCAKCRSDGRRFAMLILTGRTDERTLRTISASGISWLTKPADPDTLAAALGQMARTGRSIVELGTGEG